jgi:two-component system, sensor histidine kinase and response regulator
MTREDNRRILVIDDNEAIHEDFKKILTPVSSGQTELEDMRAAFLGGASGDDAPVEAADNSAPVFTLHSEYQGEDGYNAVCAACDADNPFALAFVDMRMPPGWDGVQTIEKLWSRDPDLQVVVCTAFSDYTWDETVERLGQSDRLLILKKPFDSIEISQLATALTEKWNLTMRERDLFMEAKRAEKEAKAYASSLETVNRALTTSKAASDMALELKTEFLVQISNEVNLRLGEVLGSVESIAEFTSKVDMSPELETALDVSQHLLRTIEEVLDVTALERGTSSLQKRRCSPRVVASEVMKGFEESRREKGLSLELRVDSKIPDEIETEPFRLRQILCNLLENAIRNTDEGTIALTVKTGKTEDWQRPKLQFEVSDTGKGISKELLGTIFQPFDREIEGSPRSGYGFGLALSRRLALLLDGDLSARSEEGQGSTFALCLAYGAVAEAEGRAA